MKKKNRKSRSSWIDITFSLTLVILTIGAIYLISINLKEDPTAQPAKKKNASPPPATIDSIDSNYPGIKIITETSNDPNNPYAIQYPQSIHSSFNDEITTYINQAKEKYLQTMLNNRKITPQKRGELNISFETLTHQSGNYSFVLVTSTSTTGLDGKTEIRSFHLKPETGKQLKLQDLFKKDNNILEKISIQVRENLINDAALKNVIRKDAMNQKTAPLWENYKNFALTDESIIFYFNENEWTDRSVGPPIVALPLEDLNTLLAYEFKLEEKEHEASTGKTESDSIDKTDETDTDSSSPPDQTDSPSKEETVNTGETDKTEKPDVSSDPKVPMGKKVALTFDDGPDPKTTTQILATLKKYDAKATFFMLGSRVEYYPEIAKNVQQAGHQLANHTWNHSDLTKANIEKIRKEITNTSAIIEKVTGQKATAFRPPYGAVNATVREQTDLPILLWSVDTLDWKHRDAAKILEIVKQQTVDGSIILMHDIHQSTADGLEAVLAYLQQEGYSFVTVSELQ